MYFSTVVYGVLLAGVALAQQPNASFNSSLIQMILKEVGPTNASSWCTAQFSSCGVLCSGKNSANNCDPSTLNYNCTCASNNSSPALQYYRPTMLSFICSQALGDCLKNNAGSSAAQDNCKQTIVCGNSSVDAFASASPSAASSTPSATGSSTGGSGSNTPSSTQSGSPGATSSKSAGDALRISQEMATGMFGAGLLGLLAVAL